ncbi:hypothetical protein PENTCL1PPCAC_28901, partial [Pristionchus entomophagus]
ASSEADSEHCLVHALRLLEVLVIISGRSRSCGSLAEVHAVGHAIEAGGQRRRALSEAHREILGIDLRSRPLHQRRVIVVG